MLFLNHKKLDVWKLSMEFICDIYLITETFPKRELYLLANQLKRASVSVSSNIAEGSSRRSANERRRFMKFQDPRWLKLILR